MSYNAESDYSEREERRRRVEAARERGEWAEMQHVYERCVAIAEKVWQEKVDRASAQQQAMAEAMRDRTTDPSDPAVTMFAPREASIPVPMFTPRDRLNFIKEVATTLFIEAGARNRNLPAKYKDVNGETELAPTKETPAGEGPVEAASGADETDPADAPIENAAQYGEPLSEAPAPRV